MQWSSRPVIVLGHGARAAGADVSKIMALGVPVLTSWQAADLVDNDHENYFGRPGVYGQRCANKVLAAADMVLTIGCRLSVPMVGHDGIRPDQRLVMVDIDGAEVRKFAHAEWIEQDAKEFVDGLVDVGGSALSGYYPEPKIADWLEACQACRATYPWVESPAHDDGVEFMNSYRFMERLQPFLRSDEVIVTDMGTALVSAHQALRLKPPQRLLTSGGLGEMGCALPYAIGASFARDRGRVLCFNCDGGMMLNLQELQTIVHHRLPVKIIVFVNDGYAMIRGTQKNLRLPYAGVNADTGVSCPNFVKLAQAMGIDARVCFDFDSSVPLFLASDGPSLLAVHIDPEQPYVPKLQPIIAADGSITGASFDDLSPRLQ